MYEYLECDIEIENEYEIELEVEEEGSSFDYAESENKPSINGVTLVGDLSLEQLGLKAISNTEIQAIIDELGGL